MGRTTHVAQATRRMTQYLRSTLCPALGISDEIERVVWPTRGIKSNLLLVHPGASPPFVLRWFQRPAQAARLGDLTRYAQSLQLPTPRVLYSECSRPHVRRHGFSVVVEELIAGEHLEPGQLTAGRLDALGQSLARLHAVESERWGPPGDPENGEFFRAHVEAKFKNRLHGIMKRDGAFEKEWKRQILDFVRGFRRSWDGGPPYALTHDKINPGNVIFMPQDEAKLLDLAMLRFGTPGADIAAALYYFCAGDEEERRFKEAYFSRLPPRWRDHFECFEPLYRAWLHLSRWASKSRDHDKRQGKRPPAKPGRVASHHQERDAMFAWIERVGGRSKA